MMLRPFWMIVTALVLMWLSVLLGTLHPLSPLVSL